MLAAASAAKDRLARTVTYGGRSASREPVCSEDAVAHASLMEHGSTPPSHSPVYCQRPITSKFHSVSSPGGLGAPGFSQFQGYPASTFSCSDSPMAIYASRYAQVRGTDTPSPYSAFMQPGSLPPRPAVSGVGASAIGYASSKSKLSPDRAGDTEAGEEEEEGEEDVGVKVQPLVTCRLICCYILLLAMGMAFGMVANELHWSHLTQRVHPWLVDLEEWLHKPHYDPSHGGEYCEDGLFVPGPPRTGANNLLFLVLLLWAFLGVAIAADVFMAGIEKITSQETIKTLVLPSGEVRQYTITVWNGTIANLTLMALGSSAPEILLSVIEICGNSFYAGELGPSTIVGSAAFNMLIISAVCVIAIPEGGGRLIKELPVFYITAAFSLVAYLWLIVILVYISPNIVEVWEGVVTFAMFPLLVYVAYHADIADNEPPPDPDDSPEGAAAATTIGYGKNGRPITRNDVARIVALKSIEKLDGEEQLHAVASMLLPPQSKAYYRKMATRAALGSTQRVNESSFVRKRVIAAEAALGVSTRHAVVQWSASARRCRENELICELSVVRSGNLQAPCTVQYMTESGTATEGVDFEAARGTVTFAPGQRSAKVKVRIIDDDEEEDDETFKVRLHTPIGCMLGLTTVCEVTILDDDGPGELRFESRDFEIIESVGVLSIQVLRSNGCQGTVGCHWSTRDGSCKSPAGYTSSSGRLIFGEGVTQMTIQVPIIDTGAYHRDDDFQVVLTSASGGARFVTDSVSRTKRATISAGVTVSADRDRTAKVEEMIPLLDFSSAQAASDSGSWREQFAEAVEMPHDGSTLSLIVYVAALPWKIIGAAVPPPSYSGGWVCFGVALVFIGLLTALIGDLASHMGCCMGLQKSVTAITFVALGTSLPDTFASRTAAANEPYADASIVNVTGSNSVNVFLGLGLPWMAAAIYWSLLYGADDEKAWRKRYANEPWYTPASPVGFAVPAGDLAYSVRVFCATSAICLCLLILRRKVIGFELGGPPILKWITFWVFVALWFVYIFLSISHTA